LYIRSLPVMTCGLLVHTRAKNIYKQGTTSKGKAATNYHSLRGGLDDPNCARLPNPPFTFKGSLVDPRLRASNNTNAPSKLACSLFRDGG